ncbi:MAG TPA: hypothetical protein DDZ51_00660 [Planctomycetaceae bacterium]|nr:hypothetical protein [Planctomycetaceae bacterium]
MILRLWIVITDDPRSQTVVTAIRHRLTTGIVGKVRGWWIARSAPTGSQRDLIAILRAINDRLDAEAEAETAASAETAADDPAADSH